MRIIEVIIKNEHYKVELEDNKSADIFLERLPLKIKVKELLKDFNKCYTKK